MASCDLMLHTHTHTHTDNRNFSIIITISINSFTNALRVKPRALKRRVSHYTTSLYKSSLQSTKLNTVCSSVE